MQIFLNEIANRYPNDNVVMVLDGTKARVFSCQTICDCCSCRHTRPNLIRRNTSGTNSRKNISTTGYSTVSIRSKTISSLHCAILKTIPSGSNASPDGIGLLMPFLMQIRSTGREASCPQLTHHARTAVSPLLISHNVQPPSRTALDAARCARRLRAGVSGGMTNRSDD